ILGFETSSTAVDIAFFTDDLYIDKSLGYLGIGTTAPDYDLDVLGTIQAYNFINSAGMPVNDILLEEEVRNLSITAMTGSLGLDMAQFVEKVSETTFNAGDTSGTSGNVLTAHFPNGNVLIAYRDVGDSSYGKFVIYDSAGNVVKAETTFKADSISWPSTTILQNGNILITYGTNFPTVEHFVIYDSAGNEVVSETTYNEGGAMSPSATTLTNGNVLIAYRDTGDSSYGKFVIYDSAGNVVKAETTFSATDTIASVATLTNGNVLIAYGANSNGYFIILDSMGKEIVSETIFNTGSVYTPSLKTFNNGNILIAYRDGGSSSYGKFVIYDSSGNLVKPETTFNSGTTTALSTTNLTNGNILIAYQDWSASAGNFVIYDSVGNLVKPETTFHASSIGNYLSVTTLTNGNVLIAYIDSGDSNYGKFVIWGSSGASFANLVGIGTTNPLYKLDVFSSTSDPVARFSSSDDLAQILLSDNDTTGYLNVKDSIYSIGLTSGLSANNLNINSSGNIGIGTTAPSQELDVVGDIELNNYLYFGNGSTEYLRWDGSDFILSDDFLPLSSASLNLGSDAYRWGDLYLDGATLHIGSSTASEGLISYASNILGFETSSTAVDIAFFTDDLYIDKSLGYLGIGTTAPDYELDVLGTIQAYNFINSAGMPVNDILLEQEVRNLSITAITGSLGLDMTSSFVEKTAGTTFNSGSSISPSVTTLTNGNVLIAYQDAGSANYGNFVIYDSLGNLVVSETTFNAGTTYTPSATTLTNGNILIVYQDSTSSQGNFVIYDSVGNLIKSETTFNAGTTYTPSATTLTNGNVLIAYRGPSSFYPGYIVIYDSSGNPVQSTTPFDAIDVDTPSATTLTNGNVLIAYVDRNDNGKFVIYGSSGASFANMVGIGTTAPAYKLDVQDTQASTYAAKISNLSTSTAADGLLIALGIGSTRGTGNVYVGFAYSGTTVAGRIRGNGTAVSYETTGADYAEYFLAEDFRVKPEPGDIVSLSQIKSKAVTKAVSPSKAIGVISDSAGFVGNGPLCEVDDESCDENYEKTNVVVGITGQLDTKVSTKNGTINLGDPLTTSDIPGVAVKATKAGNIIGHAMESYSEPNPDTVKRIKVYLNSTWFDPDSLLVISESGVLEGDTLVNEPSILTGETQNIGNYDLLTSSSISTDSLETKELTIDGINIDDYIKNVLSEAGLGTVNESTESSESIPTTNTGILAEIQALYQEFKDMILALGMTSHIDELGNNYLSIDSDVKMAGDLNVLGDTTTSNLTVTGNIQAGTVEIDTVENSINVLGVSCYNPETGGTNEDCVEMTDQTLYLQKTSSGNLNIFNGKLVIEPNGTMKLDGNLEVTGTVKSDTVEADTVIIKETKTPDLELGPQCKPGEMTWDQDYIYICTSENMWSRSKLELIPGQTQVQSEPLLNPEEVLVTDEPVLEPIPSESSPSEPGDTIVTGDTSPSEILNP
ncbi:MAG TPA: hypothetical protein PLX95_03320, partial [bacterium]|nr:hypothetical protein [bacterium]